jgi:hypothetical protein
MLEIFVFFTILFGSVLAVVSFYLIKASKDLNQVILEREEYKARLRRQKRRHRNAMDNVLVDYQALQEELENTCAFADSQRAHYEEYQADLMLARNNAFAALEKVLEERSYLPNYKPHRLMVA